jgi:hypothetical protein
MFSPRKSIRIADEPSLFSASLRLPSLLHRIPQPRANTFRMFYSNDNRMQTARRLLQEDS